MSRTVGPSTQPSDLPPTAAVTAPRLVELPHHDGSALYVPDEVPSLGDVVPVRVRVPHGASPVPDEVWVRTVRDGEPFLERAVVDRPADRRAVTPETERETWYRASVRVTNPVTSYRFLLRYGDTYRWLDGRGLHSRDVSDAGDFRLSTHGGAPRWARDAVVYQVFPDRFARSALADERPAPSWAVPRRWDDPVDGFGRTAATQLYGGDLRGVEEHLDHLQRLGVDVVYLTPFFPGRSNHRYDATSFETVDPLLGGDEALASLSRAVHARGMRLMGDLTTNHTGLGHDWFRTALADPDSPEHGFYYWSEDGHVGWKGFTSLPKLRYDGSDLAGRLVRGPGSVASRWLREPYALDGWRIDVANMTGRLGAVDLAHQVAHDVRETLQEAREEALLVGEHFHDATADAQGDGWHAVMNYAAFTRPVWAWVAPEHGAIASHELPGPVARRTGGQTVATMREFGSAVPWAVTRAQWNLLASHDTPRIQTVAGDPARVLLAVVLLLTYPGTPVVFAGEEWGLEGRSGEESRRTMPWDDPSRQDEERFETFRALVALRHEVGALRDGGLRWVVVEDDALGYLRETPEERVLVVVARDRWSGARLPASLLGGGRAERLFGTLETELDGDELVVDGTGAGAGVWRLG